MWLAELIVTGGRGTSGAAEGTLADVAAHRALYQQINPGVRLGYLSGLMRQPGCSGCSRGASSHEHFLGQCPQRLASCPLPSSAYERCCSASSAFRSQDERVCSLSLSGCHSGAAATTFIIDPIAAATTTTTT
jgi:hypothetical protein